MENQKPDLVRTVFSIAFIGGLAAASLWVLKPFLGATIWATMFAVATWPMMKKVQGWLFEKRSLAVIAMSLALLAVIMVPAVIAVTAIVQNVGAIRTFLANLPTQKIPLPPETAAVNWAMRTTPTHHAARASPTLVSTAQRTRQFPLHPYTSRFPRHGRPVENACEFFQHLGVGDDPGVRVAAAHQAPRCRVAKRQQRVLDLDHRLRRDYFPPAISFWNLGFVRSGSKLGSILSQPGVRT